MSGLLKVRGQTGKIYNVSHGVGLGVRQHDDVMLSYGYSHKITKIVTIPANQFAVMTLNMPSGLKHHSESRFVEAYNGILDVKVIVGLLEGDLPVAINQIPAFNEKYAVLNPLVKSIFQWRGVHATNPITGLIDDTTTVDEFHLHATSGNARQAGEASSSSVKGRYYTTGINTLLVENKSNADVEFTYIYGWHEFE